MSNEIPSSAQQAPKRWRLWLWFFVGSLVVFVGLALFYPTYFFDGGSLRQTVLWQYYFLELQLKLNSNGNLGPTSGNWAAALTTAVSHVIISAVAGAIAMGIGWVSQKRSTQ